MIPLDGLSVLVGALVGLLIAIIGFAFATLMTSRPKADSPKPEQQRRSLFKRHERKPKDAEWKPDKNDGW